MDQYAIVTLGQIKPQMKPIPDATAANYLTQIEMKATQAHIKVMPVKCPQPGTAFVCAIPPQIMVVPSDGYVWQDDDKSAMVSLPGLRPLEILSREKGTVNGQLAVTRKRYRFINSQFQLIHYLPASGSSVKAQQQPQQVDEEVSGDELDHVTLRDVSSARYKRNHMLMEDLFTPVHADHIKQDQKPLFGKDVKSQKQQELKQLEAELAQLESQHQQRKSDIQHASQSVHQRINQLSDAQTQEEVEAVKQDFCHENSLKILPSQPIVRVEQ